VATVCAGRDRNKDFNNQPHCCKRQWTHYQLPGEATRFFHDSLASPPVVSSAGLAHRGPRSSLACITLHLEFELNATSICCSLFKPPPTNLTDLQPVHATSNNSCIDKVVSSFVSCADSTQVSAGPYYFPLLRLPECDWRSIHRSKMRFVRQNKHTFAMTGDHLSFIR
jgi:hypothetical protein